MSHSSYRPTRRQFLAGGAAAGAAVAVSGGRPGTAFSQLAARDPRQVRGSAEHCIMFWLGGGMGQIDTFDPKERLGDPENNKPGSYYPRIATAVRDAYVCEHLPRVADRLDRMAVIRTVTHDEIDEHAAATNRMHTGRPTTGSIVYPSVGSIVAHEKGDGGEGVPRYVLIGYPNVARGPGFLGAEANFLYLTDTKAGPAALQQAKDIGDHRQQRRAAMLNRLRQRHLSKHEADRVLADYDTTVEQAQQLAGPQFMKTFQLDEEPADLRESYGDEFGQRCLLARRLVERGVRFIEVSHNLNFVNGAGWDVHQDGILKQHLLIEELDRALSTLVADLEQRKLLEKTLIVVSTEFGRPAGFDFAGGRGHHSRAFSVVMAGGGLKGGSIIGETNELAEEIVSRPVTVPDLFATKFAALGINPRKPLFAGERPVPISDMGTPVHELFA